MAASFFGFAGYAWIVWQQPYWLLLLIPLVAGLFFRYHAHYVQKTHDYLKTYQRERRFLTRMRFALPLACIFFAMVLLVAALGDVTKGYVVVEEQARAHRIFVWVDSSSSMYSFKAEGFSSITCEKNAEFFPRIHGACRALSRLINEVERFSLNKEYGKGEDIIGIGQFARDSYVIAYPSNDYSRLREKVHNMQFLSQGILGIHTNIHLAMWDLYLMALDRNLRGANRVTHVNGKELRLLAKSLEPEGMRSLYIPPRELMQKLSFIKEELRDTVFIFITDALVGQMDMVLNVFPYSLKKQMELAAFLELSVFYLSVEDYHPELKRMARLTGFGPPDGDHRGDFLIVRHERDFVHIEELIERILKARFNMITTRSVERRESYGELCVQFALIFSVCGLVLRHTIARSLTDI